MRELHAATPPARQITHIQHHDCSPSKGGGGEGNSRAPCQWQVRRQVTATREPAGEGRRLQPVSHLDATCQRSAAAHSLEAGHSQARMGEKSMPLLVG